MLIEHQGFMRVVSGVLLLMCAVLIGCVYGESISDSTPSDEVDLSGIELTDGSTDFASVDQERSHVFRMDAPTCGIPDPAIDTAAKGPTVGFNLVSEIHAGLMGIDLDGNLVPALAERYASTGYGAVHEFTLRQELRFSDGSQLTARDVKWSWERALRKSTGTGRANEVLGAIKGAAAVLAGESDDLSGVTVVDDRTMRVELDQPNSDFPMLLADPISYVLKPEKAQSWDDRWANAPFELSRVSILPLVDLPVGAGPFKLIDFPRFETFEDSSDVALCELARNEFYWAGPAELKGVIINVVPGLWSDENTTSRQADAFDSEVIDFRLLSREASVNGIDLNGSYAALSPQSWFLVLNPSKPPFDDVRFRRALAKSANVSLVFPELGVSSTRLIPESLSKSGLNVEGFSYDIVAAKNDLEQSRYFRDGDLISVEFSVVGFIDELIDHLEPIFDEWRQSIGVDVEVQENELTRAFMNEEETSFDQVPSMVEVRVSPRLPEKGSIFMALVNAFGEEYVPGEFRKIKQMIEDASAELDDAERISKHEAIEQYILDQAFAIPIFNAALYREYEVQPWISEIGFPRYSGSVFYRIRLDPSA